MRALSGCKHVSGAPADEDSASAALDDACLLLPRSRSPRFLHGTTQRGDDVHEIQLVLRYGAWMDS